MLTSSSAQHSWQLERPPRTPESPPPPDPPPRIQGLKLAYERLIGGSFEEMLKEADVAGARSQGSGAGNEHALRRVTKTSDVVLTQGPRVFNLAIGWESAQVGTSKKSPLYYIGHLNLILFSALMILRGESP